MKSLEDQIRVGIDCLKRGGVIGFPTETVFGLGGDATNPNAIARIYEVKSRPKEHPLILHLGGVRDLDKWVQKVPLSAEILASKFWPGPLTLILKAIPDMGVEFRGRNNTVAVRVPAHPVAQALILGLGKGVVAPSANRFGRLSPTSAQHVSEELGSKIDMVIDGATCSIGIESTIVDLTEKVPLILRPGHIDEKQISDTLGEEVLSLESRKNKAPGSHPVHYAPNTPLTVVYRDDMEKFLHKDSGNISVAVLGRSKRPFFSAAAVWQVAPSDPVNYARNLYALLRRLDHSGCDLIAVEEPPHKMNWFAIHDRLKKSSIPKMALPEFIKNQSRKKTIK